MYRILCLFLVIAATTFTTPAQAQKRGKTTKTTQKVVEPSPEELLAREREEAMAKRFDELLENTRKVTFIDSLVVDKDNFLAKLRLTADAGRFTQPQNLFAETGERTMGMAAYVNALSSAVYFSVADSTGTTRLHAAYRSGQQWSTPTQLVGLEDFAAQDYPFLLSDGTTLYFSAEGEEGIGGRDIFATRYNAETGKFVPPFNVGLPFNSTANDYLLAIDESAGIGALVSDRRQPDDKVCIYWFVAESSHDIYDYDPEDEDERPLLLAFAEINSIAATQTDAGTLQSARERWQQALNVQHTQTESAYRFIINDTTVYTSLDDFVSPEARALAAQWLADSQTLNELLQQLDHLRSEYSTLRSERIAGRIRNLEVQAESLRKTVAEKAKQYRKAEQKTI